MMTTRFDILCFEVLQTQLPLFLQNIENAARYFNKLFSKLHQREREGQPAAEVKGGILEILFCAVLVSHLCSQFYPRFQQKLRTHLVVILINRFCAFVLSSAILSDIFLK